VVNSTITTQNDKAMPSDNDDMDLEKPECFNESFRIFHQIVAKSDH
jgi:hypothetical protein